MQRLKQRLQQPESCLESSFSIRSFATKRHPRSKASRTHHKRKHAASEGLPTKNFKPTILDRFDVDIPFVFGPNISVADAKSILLTLQQQRETGYIDRGVPLDSSKGITNRSIEDALNWLRRRFPVDEDAAIMKRLEQEEREEEERLKNPQVLHDYDYDYAAGTRRVGGVKKDRFDPQGQSVLMAHQKEIDRVERKRARLQKLERAKEASQGLVGGLQRVGQKGELATENQAKWWTKYYEDARVSGLKEPPRISAIRRLFPSTVVMTLTLLCSYALASLYTTPPDSARMFPDISLPVATIIAIAGINVAVFLAWRIPPLWKQMNKHFLLTPAYPFASSIICSTFSHQAPRHLLLNTVFLFACGLPLHSMLNRGEFLGLYFSAAVIADYTTLLTCVLGHNWTHTSLGASGALFALFAALCIMNTRTSVQVRWLRDWFPNMELPSWTPYVVLGTMIALEVMAFRRVRLGRLVPPPTSQLNHVSHLAGYGFGTGIGFFFKRRNSTRRDNNAEQVE